MIGTLGGAAKLNQTDFKSMTHDDVRPLLLFDDTWTSFLMFVVGAAVDGPAFACALVDSCCGILLLLFSSGMGTYTDSDDLNENFSLSFAFVDSFASFPFASVWILSRGVFGVIGFRKLIRAVDVSVGFAVVVSSKLTTVFGSFG